MSGICHAETSMSKPKTIGHQPRRYEIVESLDNEKCLGSVQQSQQSADDITRQCRGDNASGLTGCFGGMASQGLFGRQSPARVDCVGQELGRPNKRDAARRVSMQNLFL